MRPLLFIDLWPEVCRRGYWKKRFSAVPATTAAGGFSATVEHFTRLDSDAIADAPPAGIILSGSRSNILEDPATDPRDGVALSAFAGLTGLLARIPQVPVLGICFGLQYLTAAAGGELGILPSPRRAPAWPIDLLESDPLFAGLRAPRCVENHAWSVTRAAPGYRVVARSADGVEAARHERLPRVGVQFHPEYFRHPGATRDGERVLRNWLATL